jgi:hypothetical protein
MERSRLSRVLECYLSYCIARQAYRRTGELRLEVDFVFPTTLLPLLVLMDQTGAQLQSPSSAVRGYVRTVSRTYPPPAGSTYFSAIRLPRRLRARDDPLTRLEDLSKTTRLFSGNSNAYHYLLSELVDNIYNHAGADHAYLMAQFYPNSGEIEASFMDDGVTIPGSLEQGAGRHYVPDQSYQAIVDALGGASAKTNERGYGLRTSVRIANELGGEVLIVSGRGAVVVNPDGTALPYQLTEDQDLRGTLVSVRLREGDRKINFYKLVEG